MGGRVVTPEEGRVGLDVRAAGRTGEVGARTGVRVGVRCVGEATMCSWRDMRQDLLSTALLLAGFLEVGETGARGGFGGGGLVVPQELRSGGPVVKGGIPSSSLEPSDPIVEGVAGEGGSPWWPAAVPYWQAALEEGSKLWQT